MYAPTFWCILENNLVVQRKHTANMLTCLSGVVFTMVTTILVLADKAKKRRVYVRKRKSSPVATLEEFEIKSALCFLFFFCSSVHPVYKLHPFEEDAPLHVEALLSANRDLAVSSSICCKAQLSWIKARQHGEGK